MAAVDLGSNSFHMVVGRTSLGQLTIVDRLREMVRLASGLNDFGYLDSSSQDRALACLRRFGQRLRDMHADQVRVVGTSTLRKAGNAESFLSEAEDALGHPVEVISGMEEARLVYLGVSHHTDSSSGRSLVADIGGGSTELIIGEGYDPIRLESLSLGCVSLSRKFFGGGRLTKKRFARARLAVRLELRPIVQSYRKIGWDRAVGSSGTIRAAESVITALGGIDGSLTSEALEAVIKSMIEAERLSELELPGLGEDRAPVFPGGIVILAEVLSNFRIASMTVSDGALREGLLYDMMGRVQHEDARERSVRVLQNRFNVDDEQAQRVEATVILLHKQVARDWKLDDGQQLRLLQWAARLHEIGLDIAHSRYHQHGAYLIANADLPGFARLEQQLLAVVVGHHRRKLDAVSMSGLPGRWRKPLFKLIVLLRLAVLINRGRGPAEMPPMKLAGAANKLEVNFPKKWFAANPLTHVDLQQEQKFLLARGFELSLGALKQPKGLRPVD